jgi:Putative 2OG-Fe(II) oxygenase
MSLKVAYFQPIVLAIDQLPPVEFSKIYGLAEDLHQHSELNDANNPLISIRGGQQIQVYPNQLGLDVNWLVTFLETLCQGYLELVSAQSGTEDLKYCKPVITSIWTIRQSEGEYQEMHTHPGGHLSGNMYINAPELDPDSLPSDGQISFRLPQTRDITKFVMNDNWKYNPTPGTVILFPSHLPHTVYPWKGKGYRTVMAFDAKLVAREELLDGQS